MNWCTYSSCESWWFKQASGLASRKSNWVAVKHSIIQFKSGSTKNIFLVHVILYYELWVKTCSAQRVVLFSKLVSLLSRAIWRELAEPDISCSSQTLIEVRFKVFAVMLFPTKWASWEQRLHKSFTRRHFTILWQNRKWNLGLPNYITK